MTAERLSVYTPEQRAFLDRIEGELSRQLGHKPRRLSHSLSVADTSERLALEYGVDPFEARVAGTLHDWSKALPNEELLDLARGYGIDMGVDLQLVLPLLHGIVAAEQLPAIFPELSDQVLQAIRVHTTGSSDPTPLDQVVFVADGIEPLRPDSPGIVALREMVGRVTLDELFFMSFSGGAAYVIETGRYLYPGTVDIYNALALGRMNKKEHE